MGSKKNVDMSVNNDVVKIVENTQQVVEEGKTAEADVVAAPKKEARVRSKKYVAVRSQVDKTKIYDAFSAIELVKKLSYSKFDGTITVDVVVKDTGTLGKITLPYSTGKSVKVAIVDDAVIAEIAAGNIDFDFLVTTPQFMPKLAKHARVLGPRGLMPNPKNGTVTANPEQKKSDLEKGELNIKTEKKRPVIHVSLGKVSQDTKELVENFKALMTFLTGKVVKSAVSATMSPGVKVDFKV
ncbi:MAG: 50S ribosomal protein L1 [Candidatus Pacebacteria bacterium]|nr:50S ribosomal protein L1 [Candidatus Paceibacterota bacterium]PIR63550.1 MAG: 50S ribosomal protein L1 [Candidatus Pacebacteria bacterium CG10_big_fil_rev_8_21_14_0_10_40_26]PIZ79204.1 MAG: 50S ribosomal protein L1 [Candidatus Pacebacteria bacterium CG_4_10_14_0_2_um_filter_40_20]PJA68860.1 MAG: 50S ribosomal protein L1 [Candidatus Pacebacteria bacterium CG_4_9_14_3_um_filter_40_12]PJC42171.1 MAG: 50S ribosomal protein L1 [Candidatus Pacebacteria bacterium CG_4_9_14_0_2_um_filter_40_15]